MNVVELFHQKRVVYSVLVGVLFAVALFFATFHLAESPAVWYDERFYTQAAENIAEYGVWGLQIAPGEFASLSVVTVGYPLLLPVSFSFNLFGVGIVQARAVMVGFIMLFVVSEFFLIKRMFGTRAALLSLLLLVTFPVLYGNGKSVLGEVPGLLFLVLFLHALFRIEETKYRSVRWYALAGFSLGLSVATKPIFLVALPAVALAAVIKRRQIVWRARSIFFGIAAFFVPVFLWVMTQFQGDDSLGEILSFYANPYESENLLPVVASNLTRFFTELSPMFTLVLVIVFAFSLFFKLRDGEQSSLVELVAFYFTLLILAQYLRIPDGWYRYFFPAQMTVLIFFPPALAYCIRRVAGKQMIAHYAVAASVIVVVSFSALGLYQLLFHSYVADYYGSNKSHELVAYFANSDDSTSLFIYNVPEVVVFLKTSEYYQYLRPHDGQEVGKAKLDLLEKGVPDRIIVHAGTYENEKKKKSGIFDAYPREEVVSKYMILSKQ